MKKSNDNTVHLLPPNIKKFSKHFTIIDSVMYFISQPHLLKVMSTQMTHLIKKSGKILEILLRIGVSNWKEHVRKSRVALFQEDTHLLSCALEFL